MLDGLYRLSGIRRILLRQLEQLRDRDEACLEGHLGLGPDPEDEAVLGTIAIGLLNGRLRFANATQAEDGMSLR